MSARMPSSCGSISRRARGGIQPARHAGRAMRAGGAGIPGFYTKTGVGTVVAEGKEARSSTARPTSWSAGSSPISPSSRPGRATPGQSRVPQDRAKLQSGRRDRGKVCVAEVEEIVPLGSLDPDYIHLPGIYVHRVIKATREAHRTAHRPRRLTGKGDRHALGPRSDGRARGAGTARTGCTSISASASRRWWPTTSRQAWTSRCSRRTACSAWGLFRPRARIDADLINAGKQTITELDRTSYFSSADSFGMIRGGKIDLAILGAMEVSEKGDLANWMIPKKLVKGMGGAMDLVAGVKRVVVVMDHASKPASPSCCTNARLPLTGKAVVDRIITNLGVFDVVEGGLQHRRARRRRHRGRRSAPQPRRPWSDASRPSQTSRGRRSGHRRGNSHATLDFVADRCEPPGRHPGGVAFN